MYILVLSSQQEKTKEERNTTSSFLLTCFYKKFKISFPILRKVVERILLSFCRRREKRGEKERQGRGGGQGRRERGRGSERGGEIEGKG